jgi:ubiquinone/menaquinone biosynthesis C-methylase UbiE
MKKVEEQSASQDRWDQFGTREVQKIENNPERYVIRDSPIWHRDMSDKLAELLAPVQGKRILELGCGLGKYSVWLAKQGANVVAMDVGHHLVAAAEALARVNQVDCQFRQGNIVEPPFDSASFDVVIGLGVLHHLSTADVQQAIRECHRVLKANGKAVFYESVENSRLFNFVQNLFPAGDKRSTWYRPSILRRKAWKDYVASLDDRDMTNHELLSAGSKFFRGVRVYPYGFLIRFTRLLGNNFYDPLLKLDRALFKYLPSLGYYSQAVLIEYQK